MRTRRHALGQNFLHHQPTIEKIAKLIADEIDQAEKKPRSLLEIGPGKLALTEKIAPIAQARDLKLWLVERDRYLEEKINEVASEQAKIEARFFDAATEALPELIENLAGHRQAPVFVASNLPYSAASQILARLCHQSKNLSGAVIMVQKEMADRMMAKSGDRDRGAFSLLVQSYFEIRKAFDVSPGAFSPPPKVMSTVLTLKPLARPLTADLESPLKFEHFCKMLFSQRRKMIRNLFDDHSLFAKLGISGTERPEALELQTIIELFKGDMT